MASEGSLEDKSRVVAGVASKIFSIEIPESNVIVETLERVTDPDATAASFVRSWQRPSNGESMRRPPTTSFEFIPSRSGWRLVLACHVVRRGPAMGPSAPAQPHRGGYRSPEDSGSGEDACRKPFGIFS